MRRLLLLFLVVTAIVALLAWFTTQQMISQTAPVRRGPGEAAWFYRMAIPEAEVSAPAPALISPA